MIRFPTLANALRFLVAAGVEIGTVLDVGVHTGSAPLQEVFPRNKHILFEPVAECYETLEANYADIEHELIRAAVSDYDGTGLLQKYSIDESEEVFCNLVNGAGTAETGRIPTLTLDNFCQRRSDAKPYALKIAVDGHEMPVLRGAQSLLNDVAILIVDAGPSNLLERLNFMSSKGFQLFDIVDSTYYYGALYRMDLVFLANRLAGGLDPPPGPVAWDQWIPITDFDPSRCLADEENAANQHRIGVNEWLPLLYVAPAGERIVRAKPGREGHVFYGPYRYLPAGRYRARMRLKLSLPRARRPWNISDLAISARARLKSSMPWAVRANEDKDGMDREPVALLDVVTADGTICLAQRRLFPRDLRNEEYVLDFAVSETMARDRETVEIRMWTSRVAGGEISSVTVGRIA